jgi:hypothetical protein
MKVVDRDQDGRCKVRIFAAAANFFAAVTEPCNAGEKNGAAFLRSGA